MNLKYFEVKFASSFVVTAYQRLNRNMEDKGNVAVCGLPELFNIYKILYNIYIISKPKAVCASG